MCSGFGPVHQSSRIGTRRPSVIGSARHEGRQLHDAEPRQRRRHIAHAVIDRDRVAAADLDRLAVVLDRRMASHDR